MRCTNKKALQWMALCAATAIFICGCGQIEYVFPYDHEYDVSSFRITDTDMVSVASPFAQDLCIVTEDIMDDENVDMTQAHAAVLMDVKNRQVLYAKNAHEQIAPASLTKVMTALLAMKYGAMDQKLTASSVVYIDEEGAQLLGLKTGDTMTLSQALRIMLINSSNDVAMLVAEGVGGSVENFLLMMNEEARALGATNTNFVNPHGLSDPEHYSTAYDLYLIFQEAVKYDLFREIINMASYETTYEDKNGKDKAVSIHSTNRYFAGEYEIPDHITLIGGKTGTTNAAGHCLILLSRDKGGDLYVSVILRSAAREILYQEMTDLLDEIGN